MKIDKPTVNHEHITAYLSDLQDFIDSPEVKEERVCEGCVAPCSCSASHECACDCSEYCPMVAKQMSSDPDRYPIEAAIIPLVFAFGSLRIMQPCWSCEGHLNNRGEITHFPRVWFYSHSVSYVKLLSVYLTNLKFKKQLAYDWEITVLPYNDSPETTFCLKPTIEAGIPDLFRMRKDCIAIASNLRTKLLDLAREEFRKLSKI